MHEKRYTLIAKHARSNKIIINTFTIRKWNNGIVRRNPNISYWQLIKWQTIEKLTESAGVWEKFLFSTIKMWILWTLQWKKGKTYFPSRVSISMDFSPAVPSSLAGIEASISLRSSTFCNNADVWNPEHNCVCATDRRAVWKTVENTFFNDILIKIKAASKAQCDKTKELSSTKKHVKLHHNSCW